MNAQPAPAPKRGGVQPLGCLLLVGLTVAILGALIWAANRQETARRAADPLIGQVRAVKAGCAVSIFRRDGAAGYDETARAGALTRVKVIDHNKNGLRVEIVDGAYKGRTGWLADICLEPERAGALIDLNNHVEDTQS